MNTKVSIWSGSILSLLVALFLIFDSVIHLMNPPPVVEAFARLGIPDGLHTALGIIELACIALYVIPRTSVLGAVLLTAWLGGATAIAVRADYQWYFSVFIGVLVWTGLYLRDERVRALIPIRL